MTKEGIERLKEIKNKMNKNRSNKEKYEFIKRHLENNKISPEWVLGFEDGEGCLKFNIGKQTETTIQLQASLEIAQPILEKIKERLGCGRLKTRNTISRLIISNASDIKNKISIH